MACVVSQEELHGRMADPGADKAAKPGLLRRMLHAVLVSRERQANEELAKYLVRSGGRLTDDIEREMNQRLCSGDWKL